MAGWGSGDDRRGVTIVGLVFAILESAMIWWRVQTLPMFWIGLVWTGATVMLFRRTASGMRVVWINLAAIIGAFALCELALWLGMPRNAYRLQAGTVMAGGFARPGYFVEMPVPGIGYRPRPGGRASSIRSVDGRLAYSVVYSVDGDGLRVMPPPGPEAPRACILMFGDSLTWGEGVEDDQTTAYRLAVLSHGRVVARNFAFTGYSAHQMLWQVESGDVAAKARCDPRLPVLAIYQTLPNNVARVAGLRGWDDYGPRYRLIEDRLFYAGGFDAGLSILDDRLYLPGRLAAVLSRSVVFSRIWGRDRPTDRFDLRRFCVVVRAAADRLHRIYPRLAFVTIVWPDFNDPEELRARKVADMVAGLRAQGVHGLTIDALRPGFDTAPLPFLIAGDGHPNALMHDMLARALLARIPERAAPGAGVVP